MKTKGNTIEEFNTDPHSVENDSFGSITSGAEKEMYVGKKFESKKQIRDDVCVMSMTHIFGFEIKRSTPRYYRARCVDKNC